MATIKGLLAGTPSLSDLMQCFEMVKDNGDVAIIKFDGARNENWYTVFIFFALSKAKERIRADESNLEMALKKVLSAYVEDMD